MIELEESPEQRDLWATLSFRRMDPRDCAHRIVRVLVDEKHVGTLNFGDSLEVSVPPGLHSVTVDNTWTSKTETVPIHPQSRIHFSTGNTASGCAMTLLFTIGISALGVFLDVLEPNGSNENDFPA
ncbi:MAG TPA: hypothetical protein PKA27_04975 [Fimbriimonadaceae bacterium]|nr:hypothetical protein [Fimbriimonadaceae bacterium]